MLPLNYFLFLQIILFLFITPGPPRIVIVSYSMNYGVKKCVWTSLGDITDPDWVIWAAWADRITFEEIEKKTGKTESEVIKIMRRSIKPSSFRLWRKRVNQKSIKHRKKFEYSRKEITSKIKKGDYL